MPFHPTEVHCVISLGTLSIDPVRQGDISLILPVGLLLGCKCQWVVMGRANKENELN